MNARIFRRFAYSMLLMTVLGCSTSGAGVARPRKNSAVITTEELHSSPHPSLLALIRADRPNWLRNTQTTIRGGPASVTVYQDNFRLGGIELLEMFRPATLYSVQYYSASEAEGRYGVGHEGGVIHIRSAPPR